VELDNGTRFVTNFRYNAKPQLSQDPLHDALLQQVDVHSGDYQKFDSDCSQTMVGFVQSIPSLSGESYSLTDHKVQCFYGQQSKAMKLESTSQSEVGEVKQAQITSHTQTSQAPLVTS